jgi:hypothetical protein
MFVFWSSNYVNWSSEKGVDIELMK